jgi:hypothetical protein
MLSEEDKQFLATLAAEQVGKDLGEGDSEAQ